MEEVLMGMRGGPGDGRGDGGGDVGGDGEVGMQGSYHIQPSITRTERSDGERSG